MSDRYHTDKHRRQVAKERQNAQLRDARYAARQREEDARWLKRRAAQEEEQCERREKLQLIANLLSFHLWQLDPDKYDHWSRMHELEGIFRAVTKHRPW